MRDLKVKFQLIVEMSQEKNIKNQKLTANMEVKNHYKKVKFLIEVVNKTNQIMMMLEIGYLLKKEMYQLGINMINLSIDKILVIMFLQKKEIFQS